MAQIITQSDFPIVGTSYTLAKDSTYSGTIPSPLENQTWNFASLKNLVLDTTAFIEPNGTPYADDFPFSFLATHSISNDTYVYYNSAVDGFYVDGIGNPNTILSYNPSLLFVPVPFSFGPNDRNSVARIQKDTVNSLSQNIRIVIYFESEFKAYASGTLTIPSGTYSNVLGVRVSETRYDTLYVDTSGLGDYVPYTYSSIPSYHYRYFSSGLVVNYL